jgi:hypothetical protein
MISHAVFGQREGSKTDISLTKLHCCPISDKKNRISALTLLLQTITPTDTVLSSQFFEFLTAV